MKRKVQTKTATVESNHQLSAPERSIIPPKAVPAEMKAPAPLQIPSFFRDGESSFLPMWNFKTPNAPKMTTQGTDKATNNFRESGASSALKWAEAIPPTITARSRKENAIPTEALFSRVSSSCSLALSSPTPPPQNLQSTRIELKQSTRFSSPKASIAADCVTAAIATPTTKATRVRAKLIHDKMYASRTLGSRMSVRRRRRRREKNEKTTRELSKNNYRCSSYLRGTLVHKEEDISLISIRRHLLQLIIYLGLSVKIALKMDANLEI